MENIKKSYKKNEFKISAPTWTENFKLPDGSYSLLDIQYYFEYIIRKHKTMIDNPPIRTYVNKIENIINLKLKEDII